MNTTENKSRAQKKAKWNKPVTKAFYEKLRLKAVYVVREVHEVPGYVDIIMDFIDRYMFYQQKPFYYTESMWIWSFFAAIQGDIDKAIERRKRAKERAAERKAARERAKAEAEAEEAMKTVEAIKATEPEATEEEVSAEKAPAEAIVEEAAVDRSAEDKGSVRSRIARLCGPLYSRIYRNKRRDCPAGQPLRL